MARPKDHQREARNRADILNAARDCFARFGFHQTTMRQIIEQSGKSAGGVYHYFPSKDSIVEAISTEERQGINYLIAQLDRAKNPMKGLLKLVAAIVRETPREDAILATEIAAEACRNDTIRQLIAINDEALFNAIERGIERGQIEGSISSHLSADHLSQCVVAFYEGLIGQVAQGQLTIKEAVRLSHSGLTRLLSP